MEREGERDRDGERGRESKIVANTNNNTIQLKTR